MHIGVIPNSGPRSSGLVIQTFDVPQVWVTWKERKCTVEVENMGFGVRLYLGLKPILPPHSWVAHAEAELAYLLVMESNLHHKKAQLKFSKYY